MSAERRRHGGGASGGPGWRRLWIAGASVVAVVLALAWSPLASYGGYNWTPWLVLGGAVAVLVRLSVRRWRAQSAEPGWPAIRGTARIAAVAVTGAVTLAVLSVALVLAVETSEAGVVAQAWRVLIISPWTWMPIALSTAGLAYALQPVTGQALQLWLRRRALAPALAGVAAAELRRMHLWRTVGVLGGFNVGLAPAAAGALAETHGSPLFQPLVLPLCGYLGAVLLCEILRRRPAPTTGDPAARLDVRAPGRYLTTTARLLPITVAGTMLLLLGATELVEPPPLSQNPGPAPVAALAVALLGGVPVVHRLVVQRRQRVTDPRAMALDDVFRSSAAHAVVGASCAGGLIMIWALIDDLTGTLSQNAPGWVSWLLGVPVLALPIATFVVWVGYGSAHRGVRPRLESTAA
jgi:hypothetical protein